MYPYVSWLLSSVPLVRLGASTLSEILCTATDERVSSMDGKWKGWRRDGALEQNSYLSRKLSQHWPEDTKDWVGLTVHSKRRLQVFTLVEPDRESHNQILFCQSGNGTSHAHESRFPAQVTHVNQSCLCTETSSRHPFCVPFKEHTHDRAASRSACGCQIPSSGLV